MASIIVKETGKKLTNMEHQIIQDAKERARAGFDQLAMQLFLETEIEEWKKRDKYRTATTKLDRRSQWEMALMNGDTELAIFKTIA